eukprot:gnl/MRDRNA2_/MRDRNA2_61122_c0_seq2.p1 gnl/MRDRNA2_/MRDRNA2_61122_c0~~gnl/MRDRNA2_/MRDRNA2_61122_c0_seq2.p1  ORF type:complete len:596 (+),score=77.50 gnl/MRDRNA2_/MRDRNA2_61122_c0_seq2:58-1845(+)
MAPFGSPSSDDAEKFVAGDVSRWRISALFSSSGRRSHSADKRIAASLRSSGSRRGKSESASPPPQAPWQRQSKDTQNLRGHGRVERSPQIPTAALKHSPRSGRPPAVDEWFDDLRTLNERDSLVALEIPNEKKMPVPPRFDQAVFQMVVSSPSSERRPEFEETDWNFASEERIPQVQHSTVPGHEIPPFPVTSAGQSNPHHPRLLGLHVPHLQLGGMPSAASSIAQATPLQEPGPRPPPMPFSSAPQVLREVPDAGRYPQTNVPMLTPRIPEPRRSSPSRFSSAAQSVQPGTRTAFRTFSGPQGTSAPSLGFPQRSTIPQGHVSQAQTPGLPVPQGLRMNSGPGVVYQHQLPPEVSGKMSAYRAKNEHGESPRALLQINAVQSGIASPRQIAVQHLDPRSPSTHSVAPTGAASRDADVPDECHIVNTNIKDELHGWLMRGVFVQSTLSRPSVARAYGEFISRAVVLADATGAFGGPWKPPPVPPLKDVLEEAFDRQQLSVAFSRLRRYNKPPAFANDFKDDEVGPRWILSRWWGPSMAILPEAYRQRAICRLQSLSRRIGGPLGSPLVGMEASPEAQKLWISLLADFLMSLEYEN